MLSRLEEKRDPALPSVLVSHCFVAGSTASDSESTLYVGGSGEVGAGCFRNFTYAALGHLHGPQKPAQTDGIPVLPCAIPLTRKSRKKGCTVVTLKGYETDCRQVPVVPMRPMRTLTAAFDQLMEEGKKSPCQDYVFLTLTDDKPVYMPVDQLREYYPNLLGLTSQWPQNGGLEGLTGEQQEKRELLKRGGEKEIFSAFLTSVCQSGATEEDQALFDRILAQVGRGGGAMTPIRLKNAGVRPLSGRCGDCLFRPAGQAVFNYRLHRGGKTTILDAICFALFCRATGGRRTWQDMRNLSAGEDVPTVVDFEFSLGEEQYRFQRSWRWHKVRGAGGWRCG